MDIISHAIAGAVTGYYFDSPFTGAVIGIIPDLVLGIGRKECPSPFYDFTHSFIFLLWGAMISLYSSWVVFFSLLSHMVLDIPTHGGVWNPRLFFPLRYRIQFFKEWEFFNGSWFLGMIVLLIWVFIWLSL